MADINYSDLIDEVLPELAADPSDPVTENAIRRAVAEFCTASWVWLHTGDPLDVDMGEPTVDIETPAGADAVAVLHASLDGVPLEKRAVHWLDAHMPRWRIDSATPRHFTQLDSDQIMLAPIPASRHAATLALTVALQPSRSSSGFPRWIADTYAYALADGAVARLMLMPGKPWTDQANGADRRARFDAAAANARAAAVMAMGGASIRTTSQH